MADDPYVEAPGSPPSFLTPSDGGEYYLWIARSPISPRVLPMGVFSDPPPPELAHVDGIPVGESNAVKAGAWITQRIFEALAVSDKLIITPPP